MAAINNKINLKWGDKTAALKVTFADIEALEDSGVSVGPVLAKVAKGETPLTKLASVLAFSLTRAGVDVSAEEVYSAMYSENAEEVTDMAMTALVAYMPNFEADQKKAKPRKARK